MWEHSCSHPSSKRTLSLECWSQSRVGENSCIRTVSQRGTSCWSTIWAWHILGNPGLYDASSEVDEASIKMHGIRVTCEINLNFLLWVYHGIHFISESDVNIDVCNKFAYTCIAILVVYLGISYTCIWKVFLNQVNSSDLQYNKFYMVLKYSRYGLNNV